MKSLGLNFHSTISYVERTGYILFYIISSDEKQLTHIDIRSCRFSSYLITISEQNNESE